MQIYLAPRYKVSKCGYTFIELMMVIMIIGFFFILPSPQ